MFHEPDQTAASMKFNREDAASTPTPPPANNDDVLDQMHCVSRRLKDLARELGCLGYFPDDDDPDRPRAA